MSRLIIFLILLVACSSCRHTKPKTLKNGNFLDGEWSICRIMYLKNNRGFSETSFNVCPKITFTKNNKGYIQRSDPKLLYFDWQFDENIIVIRHTKNKDTDDVIDDGNYKIIQPNNKVYSEIDLLDTVKGIKYILGR